MKDTFDEVLLAKEEVKDEPLQRLMDAYDISVSQHDVLFAEANHEKLSDKELACAENDYNTIIHDNATRKLIHPLTSLRVVMAEHDFVFENESEHDAPILYHP